MKRNSQDAYVRDLERRVLAGDLTAVRALARAYDRRGDEDPVQDVVTQIQALRARGMTFSERQRIRFEVGPAFTDEAAVRLARQVWNDEGLIEVDSRAEVSPSDRGAWVQAWVWINLPFEQTGRLLDLRDGHQT